MKKRDWGFHFRFGVGAPILRKRAHKLSLSAYYNSAPTAKQAGGSSNWIGGGGRGAC
jgi:hypothetical protein